MKKVVFLLVFGILLLGCTMPGTQQPSGTWVPGGGEPARGGSGGQVISVGDTTGGSTPSTGGSGGGIISLDQPEPGEGDVVVRIRNSRFEPQTVTVKQGKTVFWYNDDVMPHSVRMIGVFDSPPVTKDGGAYWHTFTEYPGTYAYACGIHGTASGTVVVVR